MPTEAKELKVATIESVDTGKISLKIEVDSKEEVFHFKTTEKVDAFLSNPMYSKNYGKGAVVEYSAHNGTVTLVRKAGGFKKASVVNLDVPKEVQQRSDAVILPPSPPQGIVQASLATQPITPAPTAINVIGSFDPAKVHGYEVTDTCQVIPYEPITIKVIADDPETARCALVDAWQVFGQHNEIVRETIQKHVERSLLRSV
jgi:hypothetical protein